MKSSAIATSVLITVALAALAWVAFDHFGPNRKETTGPANSARDEQKAIADEAWNKTFEARSAWLDLGFRTGEGIGIKQGKEQRRTPASELEDAAKNARTELGVEQGGAAYDFERGYLAGYEQGFKTAMEAAN